MQEDGLEDKSKIESFSNGAGVSWCTTGVTGNSEGDGVRHTHRNSREVRRNVKLRHSENTSKEGEKIWLSLIFSGNANALLYLLCSACFALYAETHRNYSFMMSQRVICPL